MRLVYKVRKRKACLLAGRVIKSGNWIPVGVYPPQEGGNDNGSL
jgi:hypothetical protein